MGILFLNLNKRAILSHRSHHIKIGLIGGSLNNRFFIILFLALGGGFLLIGLTFVGVGSLMQQGAGRTESIPLLDLAAFSQAAAGTEAALEGRISERNPFQFRPFVAYVRREYQGKKCENDLNDDDDDLDCEEVWVEDERVTPPLWLDLPGGRARLANADYQIQYPAFRQQSTPTLIARETKSYQGFRIGDPVFVTGQVVDGAEGVELKASLVAGGNRASYLANVRREAGIFTWIGGTFAVIGGLLLLYLVYSLLRGRG